MSETKRTPSKRAMRAAYALLNRGSTTISGMAEIIEQSTHAGEMARLLNLSLAAFANPDAIDIEGVAADIRKVLAELEREP